MDSGKELIFEREKAFENAKILIQVDVIQALNKCLMWNLSGNDLAMKYVTTGIRQTCRDLLDTNEDVRKLLYDQKIPEAVELLVELILKNDSEDNETALAS